MIGTHRAAQFGESLLHSVLRAQQEKFRFRHIHFGEAGVEVGLQLVARQLADLIAEQLARAHGLLYYLHGGLRVENAEIGAIHLEEHVVARGLRSLRGSLRLQARTGHEAGGTAEVGDQLADDDALPEAVEEPGGGKVSGSDAREVVPL